MTKRRKWGLRVLVVLGVLLSSYWYFGHTVRGGSISLYVVGGWHTPLKVKWGCAQETDQRVVTKFELPLNFDQTSKNELKGFWYYSYYRQCLYNHGYDFSGNPVPPSTVTLTSGVSLYTNQYGGFSITAPDTVTINSDNLLNVDDNDQLLTSLLTVGTTSIGVHVYLTPEDFPTYESILNTMETLPQSLTPLVSKQENVSMNGTKFVRATDAEGAEGFIFLTPSNHLVYVFGESITKNTINALSQSVTSF